MPKLIDYPRTNYTGAWELAEIVDETGGKCSVENAAKKMTRKVSGSFKAIIGSAVKFGLMTSKRELLSTTTLFKRIKHAYDKQEEMQFHREAFLAPPLFTQLCRKFRNRELPVQMLDVMLMREFGVEEINAQSVARVFVDGCRMCGILSDDNILADIDTLLDGQGAKRALASPIPTISAYNPKLAVQDTESKTGQQIAPAQNAKPPYQENALSLFSGSSSVIAKQPANHSQKSKNDEDAVAALFELPLPAHTLPDNTEQNVFEQIIPPLAQDPTVNPAFHNPTITTVIQNNNLGEFYNKTLIYQISVSGPGINTSLDLHDEADIEIAMALLEKIRRSFKNI